jgi:type IV pilus assembly protein PilO
MNLKTMPWWGQIVLAAVAAGAIIYSQYKMAPLALSDKSREITELERTLAEKQKKVEQGIAAQRQLEDLKRDIASLNQKLGDLKQILPTQPELGDLLSWVKSQADSTNLDLRVFSPGAPSDQQFLRELPIRMEVTGNYHQLGMFFDRIGAYTRIINVEGVRIQANADRQIQATIQASFTAKTYVFRDEAEAPKGGGA